MMDSGIRGFGKFLAHLVQRSGRCGVQPPMRTLPLFLLLAVACVALAEPPPARPASKIAIQPYGDFSAALVEQSRQAILAAYNAEVTVLPARALPKEAWYEPRQRSRADKLLDDLATHAPAGVDKVVGLTSRDISTTKGEHEDWGVFGLGSLGGKSCVISTFRLNKDGKAPKALLTARLRKVVAHEVGHTFDLDHCPTPGCLMQDAEGTIRTVDSENGLLCPDCRKDLGDRARSAAPGATEKASP